MKKTLFVLLILATIISTGCCSKKESKSNLEVKSNEDINSSEDANSRKETKLNEEAKSNKETNSNSITKSKEESKPKVEKKIIIDDKLEKTFTIKEINLEMVKCPAGTFVMGSPKEEYSEKKKYDFMNLSNYEYAEILHSVTFTKSFYIGKYEVTQDQYKAVLGINPSFHKGGDKPVENVTWENADRFCNILNKKYESTIPKGYKFALPTEAQWEYACRAGTQTSLNSGKNITINSGRCPNLDEIAWNGHNASAPCSVGTKKPNAWGIYDMHGNIEEWCRDWYEEYTDKNMIDPEGPQQGKKRIIRGGSYQDVDPILCRSAYRKSMVPFGGNIHRGFRVALVPVE